jgi:hypothetical protein
MQGEATVEVSRTLVRGQDRIGAGKSLGEQEGGRELRLLWRYLAWAGGLAETFGPLVVGLGRALAWYGWLTTPEVGSVCLVSGVVRTYDISRG